MFNMFNPHNVKISHKNMIPTMLFAKYDITDLLSSHHPVGHSHREILEHTEQLKRKIHKFSEAYSLWQANV